MKPNNAHAIRIKRLSQKYLYIYKFVHFESDDIANLSVLSSRYIFSYIVEVMLQIKLNLTCREQILSELDMSCNALVYMNF